MSRNRSRSAAGLWKLRILVFVVTLVISLGVFEIACRVVDVDFNPNPNWRFHPTLGWTQEISKEFELSIGGRRVRVEFNSQGFRDKEHAIPKPANTKRLVVIGDSFSEAVQVNLEETYWYQLGELLSEAGEKWEVINLGVGDFGTAQALLALREFGLRYQPDFVLVQAFPLNDICNNTIEHAGLCKSKNDNYRPYFVLDEDRLRPTWTQPVRHWLRSHVISFGVLEKAYLTWLLGSEDYNVARSSEDGAAPDPLLGVYTPPPDQHPLMERGWRVTEELVREIERTCSDRGIPWALVLMPFEARIRPQSWASFSTVYAHLKMSRDYPEERFGRLLAELGAPFVPLLEAFEPLSEEVLPFVDGHLSVPAHRVAAQTLHQRLTAALAGN